MLCLCWDGIFQIKNMFLSSINHICAPSNSKVVLIVVKTAELMEDGSCLAVVITIIPGSRRVAAASNL